MMKYNGKPVKPNQLASVVMNSVESQMQEEMQKAFGGLVCEVHGKSPIVKVENGALIVSCCCKTMEGIVENL